MQGNGRVIFQPGQGARVQVENGVAVARHFRGVGLAMKHAEDPAAALGRFDRELAGRKAEEIRRQRLGFGEVDDGAPSIRAPAGFRAVCDRLPVSPGPSGSSGCGPSCRVDRSREGEMCARRHEQRVRLLRVPVERLVAGDKRDRDLVLSDLQAGGMTIWPASAIRRRCVSGADRHDVVSGCSKSESPTREGSVRTNRTVSRPRTGSPRTAGMVKDQIVSKRVNLAGAPPPDQR